jgi:hypothetical protein
MNNSILNPVKHRKSLDGNSHRLGRENVLAIFEPISGTDLKMPKWRQDNDASSVAHLIFYKLINNHNVISTIQPSVEISTILQNIERAFARLNEFETLEEDWDSYGAPPIDKAMLEEARKVLKAMRDNPELSGLTGLEFHPYPSPTGGVAIDFEFQGRELRLKLYPDCNDCVVLRVLKSNPEKYIYMQSPYRFAELGDHFKWLSSVD